MGSQGNLTVLKTAKYNSIMADITYVALDIEKAGAMNKYPIVSIGWCVGDSNGNVLEKRKLNLQVDWNHDFEPRCWNEFWAKMPLELIESLKLNALPQPEGFAYFSNWLNQLEEKYNKIVFLSDNASFDIAALDNNLERYCGRMPLRYTSDNRYRSIIAPDDILWTINRDKLEDLYKQYSDHDPSNDAECIYRQYMEVLKWSE